MYSLCHIEMSSLVDCHITYSRASMRICYRLMSSYVKIHTVPIYTRHRRKKSRNMHIWECTKWLTTQKWNICLLYMWRVKFILKGHIALIIIRNNMIITIKIIVIILILMEAMRVCWRKSLIWFVTDIKPI